MKRALLNLSIVAALFVALSGVHASASVAAPTLGGFGQVQGAEGLGTVRPSSFTLALASTRLNVGRGPSWVGHVVWSSWGGARAVGVVTPIPNECGRTATCEPPVERVVAFNLGSCGGHPAYGDVALLTNGNTTFNAHADFAETISDVDGVAVSGVTYTSGFSCHQLKYVGPFTDQ